MDVSGTASLSDVTPARHSLMPRSPLLTDTKSGVGTYSAVKSDGHHCVWCDRPPRMMLLGGVVAGWDRAGTGCCER